MHKEAEYGVASHALYKTEGETGGKKKIWLLIKNISDENPADNKRFSAKEHLFLPPREM